MKDSTSRILISLGLILFMLGIATLTILRAFVIFQTTQYQEGRGLFVDPMNRLVSLSHFVIFLIIIFFFFVTLLSWKDKILIVILGVITNLFGFIVIGSEWTPEIEHANEQLWLVNKGTTILADLKRVDLDRRIFCEWKDTLTKNSYSFKSDTVSKEDIQYLHPKQKINVLVDPLRIASVYRIDLSFLKKDKVWLENSGTRIEAVFLRFDRGQLGGRSVLVCNWLDPKTKKKIEFTSMEFKYDRRFESSYVYDHRKKKIKVVIDPDQPQQRYIVDMAFLNLEDL